VAVTYVINEGVSYPIGSNDSLVVKDYKILQLLEKTKNKVFLNQAKDSPLKTIMQKKTE
jgi:hypothetical protein